MATGLFSKLWPLEVRFLKGEQPTHTKLNGAFKQIESAFFMLESFLGNGTDNRVESGERKLLFNLSNAIGTTSKLYKPANKITTLEQISLKYGKTTGSSTMTYDATTDTLEVDELAYDITIPVNGKSGDVLSIYYNGNGKIMKDLSTYTTLPDHVEYGWQTYTLGQDTSFLRLSGAAGQLLSIRSLFLTTLIPDLSDPTKTQPINKAYSIPIENANYFKLKTPCMWSNPTNADATKCASKSCDYCIGNTYEYDILSLSYGLPKCSEAISETAAALSYSAETQISNSQRAGYLTIQSPMVTISNKYGLKYKPIAINDYPKDIQIPQNECIVYDGVDSASTIKYTTSLFSAGRSDILYIKDIAPFQAGLNNTKRYIVLGRYGLTDLCFDMMSFMEVQLPIEAYPANVAIYADDAGN